MKTTQQTKTTAKPARKSAAKSKPASKPAHDVVTVYPYAVLLAEALAGLLGRTVQRFYVRAAEHHKTSGKSFPRPEWAGQTLKPADEIRAYLDDCGKRGVNVSNDGWSRRLYDEMRVQSVKAPQDAIAAHVASLMPKA